MAESLKIKKNLERHRNINERRFSASFEILEGNRIKMSTKGVEKVCKSETLTRDRWDEQLGKRAA